MREFHVYLVTGRREYRGHAPGTEFEAELDHGPLDRAIARGDIKRLRRVEPGVPKRHTFPDGWLPPPEGETAEQTTTGRPRGRPSHWKEGRR